MYRRPVADGGQQGIWADQFDLHRHWGPQCCPSAPRQHACLRGASGRMRREEPQPVGGAQARDCNRASPRVFACHIPSQRSWISQCCSNSPMMQRCEHRHHGRALHLPFSMLAMLVTIGPHCSLGDPLLAAKARAGSVTAPKVLDESGRLSRVLHLAILQEESLLGRRVAHASPLAHDSRRVTWQEHQLADLSALLRP